MKLSVMLGGDTNKWFISHKVLETICHVPYRDNKSRRKESTNRQKRMGLAYPVAVARMKVIMAVTVENCILRTE